MLVIPSEARNLKISQSLCSFEMTTFFCRSRCLREKIDFNLFSNNNTNQVDNTNGEVKVIIPRFVIP